MDTVRRHGRFRAPHVLMPAILVISAAGLWAQDAPIFSTDSELVVVQVTVTDRKGAYVEGLTQAAFGVIEEGVPQTVGFFADADTPVTVGLLVDSSGSMYPNRDLVIAGAAAFVHASHPRDEIFALAFNDVVRPALASPAPFTSDSSVLRAALEQSIAARGPTALYDAISAGVDYLARGTRERKALVVLSDGGDNASRSTRDAAVRKAQASNAAIYTIALVDDAARDANPRLLKALAEESGGSAFRPGNSREIETAFERIARDIRHTYTLGYTPSNPVRDGAFRRIRVVVTAPPGKSLIVRTRAGYVAGGTRKAAP